MTRNSPAVQAALDEWRKGYRPDSWAERILRSRFRSELEISLAQLVRVIEAGGDELTVLQDVQSFAEYVGRLDADLRRSLAGDRHPGTEDARAAPIRRAS